MSKSQFQSFEILALKNTAKTVNTLVTKKNKLKAKINDLEKEVHNIENTISKWEAPIKERFGYSSEELINKVVEEGKAPKWVLKYPETILPPTEENTISNDATSTKEDNNNSEIVVDNSEEMKEVFEDYIAQQAIDEAKEPTSDLPFGE